MQNIQVILSLSATTFGLLVTVVGLIIKAIRTAKAKRRCENATTISNAVLPFIREAERLVHYTGVEKKLYVMTKAAQFALNNKISFDEELVSSRIEELVALTRQVNTKIRAKEVREIEKEIKEITDKNEINWL